MSKIDKQKERWNRIKSKGKKRYLLNFLLIYMAISLLFPTLTVFGHNKVTYSLEEILKLYLMYLISWSLMGVLFGNITWKNNNNKYET